MPCGAGGGVVESHEAGRAIRALADAEDAAVAALARVRSRRAPRPSTGRPATASAARAAKSAGPEPLGRDRDEVLHQGDGGGGRPDRRASASASGLRPACARRLRPATWAPPTCSRRTGSRPGGRPPPAAERQRLGSPSDADRDDVAKPVRRRMPAPTASRRAAASGSAPVPTTASGARGALGRVDALERGCGRTGESDGLRGPRAAPASRRARRPPRIREEARPTGSASASVSRMGVVLTSRSGNDMSPS